MYFSFVVLAVLFDAKSTKNFGTRKKSSQAPFAHATKVCIRSGACHSRLSFVCRVTVIPWFVLPLICCRLFFLLSFYHILFMTEKYAKGPGTRKFQSIYFLVVNTAFTATRAAPISSVLRTTNCWRCRRFENSRVASDIFQSKRVLKHTPLGN